MIIELRALGPVELRAEGQRYDIGPEKLRCILGILLLTPRKIVAADVLARWLWDGEPPPKAREDLSSYISRLRRSLRQAAGDRIRLVQRAHGYLLDLDSEMIDLHRFRLLRRQAAAISGSGDSEHAAGLLREAEALWHGPALAGLPGGYLARIRGSLDEERRAAIAERIGLDLQLGLHAQLLGELRELLARYPLDEALAACQMTALYRSGRPSDALAAFREISRRLVREQGTQPAAALARLHQRILAGDPDLSGPPQPPARPPPPDTLPPGTEDFVGRTAEIHALTGEQASTPLIRVIEGMPGVGKTALAVRAARDAAQRYPDGSLYLSLHAHDPRHPPVDPSDALDQLLRMLSVAASGSPLSEQQRAALWRDEIGRRRAVVVLDDAAGPEQVRPLLPGEGSCLILITSRRRLRGLAGVRRVTLGVLPDSDAVTLFCRIAGPGHADNQDAVGRAVQLCGRLPLAIRLTAGQLRRSHAPALAELVEDLASPWPDPAAQDPAVSGVMAAFELSYRGLTAQEQRFFRYLAASPCTRLTEAAAAAVTGVTPARVRGCLDALLDHHLLEKDAPGRYRFHDLIRRFGADQARAEDPAPEQRRAARALLNYYLLATDRADRLLYPHRQRPALPAGIRDLALPAPISSPEEATRWLDLEWRSVLQAARYAAEHEWKEECTDLTHAIAGFLNTGAYWHEAIAAHALALRASRELCDAARTARALLGLSLVSQQTGLHDASIPQAEEAAAICRALGDHRGEAAATDRMGMAHYYSADFREALAYFEEACGLYRAAGDMDGVATTLSHTGISCCYLGRNREAVSSFEAELALNRQLADRQGEAGALNNLADIQLSQGYHRDALRNYQRALAIFQEAGAAWSLAILHSNIAKIHHYKGDYEKALTEHRKALAIYRQSGDLRHHAGSLYDIGSAYQGLDLHGEALIHHQKALEIATQINDRYVIVIARRGIADAHRGAGRHAEAIGVYRAALALAREIGDLHEEAQILRGTAEAVLHVKGPREARIILRQSLDIFERLGEPEAEAVRTRIFTLDDQQTGHRPSPDPGGSTGDTHRNGPAR